MWSNIHHGVDTWHTYIHILRIRTNDSSQLRIYHAQREASNPLKCKHFFKFCSLKTFSSKEFDASPRIIDPDLWWIYVGISQNPNLGLTIPIVKQIQRLLRLHHYFFLGPLTIHVVDQNLILHLLRHIIWS
jgi:hypothetical protein